jgi:hypothetical protein
MARPSALLLRRPIRPVEPRLFRVDHHDGDGVRAIAAVADVPPHHASLEPYVSRLLRDGADGELLLVDAVTGAVVARRAIRPYRSKSQDRFRRISD